jgi:hypothetical protein
MVKSGVSNGFVSFGNDINKFKTFFDRFGLIVSERTDDKNEE